MHLFKLFLANLADVMKNLLCVNSINNPKTAQNQLPVNILYLKIP